MALCFVSPTAALAAAAADTADSAAIDIPFEKFVLDNGLTLIVHEDHKAPIVAINVWYHVGSKDEKPGKTGFAHLFEHLMFNGSEHFDDDYFKAIEQVGATDLNGTTNSDRTNYFQNVPKSALETVLWLESDRMGHLLDAVTQEKLDEQRGVVQNEKRQGENQPYGRVFTVIGENAYPEGHPYSWSTIGSMEDLDAASLEDVHEWFKNNYGAANAVVVIAGDVNAQEVKEKVEAYFGDIPAGPPMTHQKDWSARRTGKRVVTMQDRVPQARVYKIWNIPGWGAVELDHLDLASDALANGKTSRLYRRLVYEDQIATDISASVFPRELGGLFLVQASVAPGADIDEVEKALDEEIQNLLEEGMAEDELERSRMRSRSSFIRGIERIGGFGGKSDILAASEVYGGSPDAYKESLERIASADQQQVLETAREWLSDGELQLRVLPFPEYSVTESGIERDELPLPDSFPAGEFPSAQRATLSNGLEVLYVERNDIPVVNLSLVVDAGYVADNSGKPGVASLAMDMLDEGTATRSALGISDELSKLGALLSAGSGLDTSTVRMVALSENLGPSLDLFADVITNPSFDPAELERRKKQRIAGIQREKSQPTTMALRVLPKLLYGPEHPYSLPFTGSGTEESVASIERENLATFHSTWFEPGNSVLIVVGNVGLSDLTRELESHFASWRARTVPEKTVPTVSSSSASAVYLIDKPGAAQSTIFAGHLAPPKANDHETEIEAFNDILGGSFTSRLNMNLREDKHWSYGVRSMVIDARGQRPFFVMAPVQTDKTKESMAEIAKELRAIIGDQPPTGDELARVKRQNTLTLPGRWETSAAIVGDLTDIVRFDLPDDYWASYPQTIEALDLEAVSRTAKATLQPDRLIWVVVGDRALVEAGIRELGLGEIVLLDADGERLQ